MSDVGYAPKFFSLVTGAAVSEKTDKVPLQHVDLCVDVACCFCMLLFVLYCSLAHVCELYCFDTALFSCFMHMKVKKEAFKGEH